MIAWLKAEGPQTERHAYAVAFDKNPPPNAPIILQNVPSGYKTLCGIVVPRLDEIGLVGEAKVREFLNTPRCEICESLEPLTSDQIEQRARDWHRYGKPKELQGLEDIE